METATTAGEADTAAAAALVFVCTERAHRPPPSPASTTSKEAPELGARASVIRVPMETSGASNNALGLEAKRRRARHHRSSGEGNT
ncbi:MAG: hypothetical protein GY822_24395 [Deltaproteobacteria bacterium]|nr:hypothetical protein [Deltaproteobacteria bacterium]